MIPKNIYEIANMVKPKIERRTFVERDLTHLQDESNAQRLELLLIYFQVMRLGIFVDSLFQACVKRSGDASHREIR